MNPFSYCLESPTQHKAYLDFCVWEIDVQCLLTLFMAVHLHIMGNLYLAFEERIMIVH